MDYAAHRKTYIQWIKSQLMGPAPTQEQGLTGITPTKRYSTGVLFPIDKGGEGVDPACEDQSSSYEDNFQSDEEDPPPEETIDLKKPGTPPQKTYRYMPPASVGFSFYVYGNPVELQVRYSAVRYEPQKERDDGGRGITRYWKRVPLSGQDDDVINFKVTDSDRAIKGSTIIRRRYPVLQDLGELDILCRPFTQGWIITITLCNSQVMPQNCTGHEHNEAKNQSSLFEVRLGCTLDKGEVGTYPRVDPQLLSEEEQEIELQYKHHCIYALGHGAAVDWTVENGQIREIRAEFIPAVEVPQVTAEVSLGNGKVLSLYHLSQFRSQVDRLAGQLDSFVDNYQKWVVEQHKHADLLSGQEKITGKRIVQRMDLAAERMKKGVALLRKDKDAAHAFEIANQAMLFQMEQGDKVAGKAQRTSDYQWRPFQLAFLLMTLDSSANEESMERDLVDLIWFPTGGGKTEAYLGLVVFAISWRRLTNRVSGGGTAVLMRYTLRLLTSQQYLRATRIICALELIRQKISELGTEPITIGMWVGGATSPNTYKSAQTLVREAAQGDGAAPKKLVLDGCPWCRTPFKAPDNYHATPSAFYFKCTHPLCEFSGVDSGKIPCNVVDEAIYAAPPTFLIATIDKFARLTWDQRTNAFFGQRLNRPPELIIQDELHLISGALGSVAGLYEAGLDTVLIQQGVRPKYIASTATIRMAQEQVRRLYGRSVAVFPPPGLSCDDSYFARTVPLDVRPGRLYVGYLAPMLNRSLCMAPLASALLAGPEILFGKGQVDREALLEAWWTLVVYHGSLRGVGTSHNAFNVDVRNHFNRLKEETAPKKNLRDPGKIVQLTSLSTAQENAETFSRLELSRDHDLSLDAVLATNMISVGLDVGRLALMIINGQPLTTAEYIQASSRVGRGKVPGIVFINFYRDQARSISHYENFRPFHESFYRFVEPTSITPYTFQSRRRALHAALVIGLRHGSLHLLDNNQAGALDPDQTATRKVIETLKRRCSLADKERAPEILRHIDKLVLEWKSEADLCRSVKRQLDYSAKDNTNNVNRLLHNHDDKITGLWPTLQSMRSVENSALLKIIPS